MNLLSSMLLGIPPLDIVTAIGNNIVAPIGATCAFIAFMYFITMD